MTDPTRNGEDWGQDLAVEDDVDVSDVQWDDYIVLFVFWLLAFVVFLQFFTRYVLNNSLGWTEEIARFLLIGVTFIGAVMAVRKQSHIAVEILYRWLPRWMRRVLQLIVDVGSLVFYAFMTWFTVELSQRTQQMMASVDIPKAYVYWIVVVCFAAMAIYQLEATVRHLVTGTSRLIDPDRGIEAAPSLE